MIEEARTLLHDNETAMAIFTRGRNLELCAGDGDAFSGWWRLAAHRNPDKVLLYLKHLDREGAEIFRADYVRKESRPTDGRYKVYLAGLQYVGETNLSWSSFANQGKALQSPVRYLSP